jgi:hypothetical protein
MSVQSVQVHGLEQAPPVRVAGAAGTAQSRSAEEQGGPAQPQDQVIVSEQARSLSAAGASAKGSGANGEYELQLDFRKLRELSAASSSNDQTQSA